ncbi:MAG: glycosyltransferase family 4 protein, partial [Iamia sp.]
TSAFLFDPASLDTTVEGRGRFVADDALAAALGERARPRSATYTWERTAELTVAAYWEALA